MRIARASLFCRGASAPAQSWSVNPAIVGTPTVGAVCSCTSGTYSGAQSFTYQWTLDAVNISGATSATYTPVSGDATHTLRRVTTPTDGGPSSTSAGVVVAAAGTGPAPYAPYSLEVTAAKLVTFRESAFLGDGVTAYATNPPTTYTLWRSTTQGQAKPGGTGATSYAVSASGATVSGLPSGAAYFRLSATNTAGTSELSNEFGPVTLS